MSLTSKDIFVRGQHVLQIVLSLYGSAVSYGAVTNLQKYEATSKKLAEWSNTAAQELHKTRTTQTSGALAILASLVTSSALAFFPSVMSKWVRIGLSPAMLVVVLFARNHIKSYWAPKDGKNITRIPLPKMEDYNEAERRTENLLEVLQYLEYSWVIAALINGMIG